MISKKYKKLGEILVRKLRDETYENYKKNRTYAESTSRDSYDALHKNLNYDSNLQKTEDERFYFLNSLNDFQKEQLDKLILNILDQTAFNFLREIEENIFNEEDENCLGLSFGGKDEIKNVYTEFLSGTFFGEYFLWIEKYSKYGDFQH